jgi:GT2 family glycosyltransferase
MANAPLVWIVVLNYNGAEDTLACLLSLQQLRYRARKIVVVDNGSTDGLVGMVRKETSLDGINILEAGKNLGYAGGNNLGIRYALERGADFVLVLNNDTTVDPGLLDELVAAADRFPTTGCFGPWILYSDDRERLWFAGAKWDTASLAFAQRGKNRLASELPLDTVATDYVCGAALFFRASLARQIGLFDERFFLVFEESDWCYRARRAGSVCVMVPTARVWHKVGASFGSEASPLRTYFSARNKLLWAEKNVSRREFLRTLRRLARRLYPPLIIDRQVAGTAHKALVWGSLAYHREWRRKLTDPNEIAYRRGVLDYLLRRFGDCPPQIREVTRTWRSRANDQGIG